MIFGDKERHGPPNKTPHCTYVAAELQALRNTIPGDKSAMNPNGLRVGTPAMTSRGLMEACWEVAGGKNGRMDWDLGKKKKERQPTSISINPERLRECDFILSI